MKAHGVSAKWPLPALAGEWAIHSLKPGQRFGQSQEKHALDRYRAALAADRATDGANREREAAIDAALEMTFPASDPPAWPR